MVQISKIRAITNSHQDFVQAKIDEQQRLLDLLKTPSPQRRGAASARTPPPVPAEAFSTSPNGRAAGSTTPRGSPPKAVNTTVVAVQTSRPVERAPASAAPASPAPAVLSSEQQPPSPGTRTLSCCYRNCLRRSLTPVHPRCYSSRRCQPGRRCMRGVYGRGAAGGLAGAAAAAPSARRAAKGTQRAGAAPCGAGAGAQVGAG